MVDAMTVKVEHERVETYDVYDEDGKPVGRVVLPRRAHFLGRAKETVFLNRQPGLRPRPSVPPRAA